MKKRIMIISANYTGYGHRSICEALCEHLSDYDNVVIQVIDGFSLIGRAGIRASKIYGTVTRNASDLWKLTYNISSHERGKTLEDMMTALVYDRFMRKLVSFDPGLIITVHALFNRSLLNILEYHKMDIPFVTLQADIINIHRAWCDPRASLTLCPTSEAYDSSLHLHSMPKDKLELCGFPTRERFCEAARRCEAREYQEGQRINCLLMSGGEGSGNLRNYAKQLLAHVDCNLRIICGRNARMKRDLEESLGSIYPDRLEVLGFMDNVQDYMLKSDLVIARGSPNTMMEAVVLGIPLMITGSLPGQEADNPALMITHNLGVLCETPESAPAIVKALMASGGKRLREIRQAQKEYRDFDSAKRIARRIYEMALTEDHQRTHLNRFPTTILTSRYRRREQD